MMSHRRWQALSWLLFLSEAVASTGDNATRLHSGLPLLASGPEGDLGSAPLHLAALGPVSVAAWQPHGGLRLVHAQEGTAPGYAGGTLVASVLQAGALWEPAQLLKEDREVDLGSAVICFRPRPPDGESAEASEATDGACAFLGGAHGPAAATGLVAAPRLLRGCTGINRICWVNQDCCSARCSETHHCRPVFTRRLLEGEGSSSGPAAALAPLRAGEAVVCFPQRSLNEAQGNCAVLTHRAGRLSWGSPLAASAAAGPTVTDLEVVPLREGRVLACRAGGKMAVTCTLLMAALGGALTEGPALQLAAGGRFLDLCLAALGGGEAVACFRRARAQGTVSCSRVMDTTDGSLRKGPDITLNAAARSASGSLAVAPLREVHTRGAALVAVCYAGAQGGVACVALGAPIGDAGRTGLAWGEVLSLPVATPGCWKLRLAALSQGRLLLCADSRCRVLAAARMREEATPKELHSGGVFV